MPKAVYGKNMAKSQRSGDGPDPATLIAPGWTEIAILAIATVAGLIIYFNIDESAGLVLVITPLMITLALTIGALRMITLSAQSVWTCMFWTRIVGIAYIGVGSLVPIFVNAETRDMLTQFFFFFPKDSAKYNLVNLVYMLVFMLTARFLVLGFVAKSAVPTFGFERARLDLTVMGWGLLAIGYLFQFFINMRAHMDLLEGASPLLFNELGLAGQIGIFFLAYEGLKRSRGLVYVAVASAILFSALGMVLFSKTVAVFPLIMLALGFIFHEATARRIVVSFVGIVSFFMFLAGLVPFGRDAANQVATTDVPSSIAVRIDAIGRYLSGERDSYGVSELQTGWARLSYVNAGTFAINRFDAGQPGNSLRDAPLVWIPRIIYPDKPVITEIGREFSYAANGNYGSQATPALPSEGYWNFGWPGVIAFAVMIGGLFTFWSLYTIAVVRSEAWHLFIIVLMGMRVWLRIDGMFVPDILGPIGFAFLGHFALQFLNRLMADPESRGAPPRAIA